MKNNPVSQTRILDNFPHDCDDNPVLWKDDSNKIEQIAFALLWMYTTFLIYRCITNIKAAAATRTKTRSQKLLAINAIALVMLTIFFIFTLDGVVALFNNIGMFSQKWFYTFQYSHVCLLQMVLAWAYFNWSNLMAMIFNVSKQKLVFTARVFTITITAISVAQIIYIIVKFLVGDFCQIVDDKLKPIQTFINIMTAIELVNNIIFCVCAYQLAKKMQLLYEFKTHKSIPILKALAILSFIGTLLRALQDVLVITTAGEGFFFELEYNGNKADATFGEQFVWALQILVFYWMCTLGPMHFILLNFSPKIKKKSERDLRRSFSRLTGGGGLGTDGPADPLEINDEDQSTEQTTSSMV